jgi:hypothetical protein
VIFDFRFLALLAVAGSLAGSVLCFLNVSDMVLHALLLPLHTKVISGSGYLTRTRDQGCVFIKEAYQVYWSSCVKGVHTGQMVLKVVEAIGEVFVCSCS